MGSIRIDGLPEAVPQASSWPVDDDPAAIQADEMLARQLDNEFAGEVRKLLHDPETGLADKGAEDALSGVATALPLLGELKERTLAQVAGPRQRALLEPLIDQRLDQATGTIGSIARRASGELDDRTVAERLAGFRQDAALAWDDPAQLRLLGRAAVSELRYQGERKDWDGTETDANVRQGLSDLYAGAVEAAMAKDFDGAARLYDHAREVIQPEQQAALEHKLTLAHQQQTARRIGDNTYQAWASAFIANLAEDEIADGLNSTARPRPDPRRFVERANADLDESSPPRLRSLVQQEAISRFFRAGKEWLAERSQGVADILAWQKENPAALLAEVPPTLKSRLAPDQLAGFHRFAIAEGHVEPDLGLYDRLERQLLDNPRGFANAALDEYALHVGIDGLDRLSGLQEAIRKGDPDGFVARLRAGRRLVEAAVVKAGFEPDATIGQSVRAGVRDRIEEFAKVNGRQPAEDDVIRIVNDESNYLRQGKSDVQVYGASATNVQLAQADQGTQAKSMADDARFGGRDPSKFYLKFDGRYLKLYNGEEVINEWPAVSGKENFGSGKDQDRVNYGPIPEGTYDIKQSRYQTINTRNFLFGLLGRGEWAGSVRGWGTERVWADPTKETEASGLTFGRKDMAIHGGWSPGSAGCIDLTENMTDFAKEFRKLGIDLKLYVGYTPLVP